VTKFDRYLVAFIVGVGGLGALADGISYAKNGDIYSFICFIAAGYSAWLAWALAIEAKDVT